MIPIIYESDSIESQPVKDRSKMSSYLDLAKARPRPMSLHKKTRTSHKEKKYSHSSNSKLFKLLNYFKITVCNKYVKNLSSILNVISTVLLLILLFTSIYLVSKRARPETKPTNFVHKTYDVNLVPNLKTTPSTPASTTNLSYEDNLTNALSTETPTTVTSLATSTSTTTTTTTTSTTTTTTTTSTTTTTTSTTTSTTTVTTTSTTTLTTTTENSDPDSTTTPCIPMNEFISSNV
jgi:hypothetical protein